MKRYEYYLEFINKILVEDVNVAVLWLAKALWQQVVTSESKYDEIIMVHNIWNNIAKDHLDILKPDGLLELFKTFHPRMRDIIDSAVARGDIKLAEVECTESV